MTNDLPAFRPAEVTGDASRLQDAKNLLPSGDSSPSRKSDERRVSINSWVAVALLAALAAFLFYVVFVLH